LSDLREKKQVYTIDDIARELGVSKTTVSRAISGKGRISDKTRCRVQDFIQAHNYHPNAVAKSLAQNRTSNLGLVLPGDERAAEDPFFQDLMGGICEVASANDYDVLISMVSETSSAQLDRILRNHKVDGVIVSRSTTNALEVDRLLQEELPFVLAGYSPDPRVLYVDNENQQACAELTSLLIERGCHRLGLLGGDERHYVTTSRRDGFLTACHQAGLPEEDIHLYMNLNSFSAAEEALSALLNWGADCIICTDEHLCSQALDYLRRQQVSIPQELRLASFYDSSLLAHSTPSVTSLHFDAWELGKAVCQRMLSQLEGKEVQSGTIPGYHIMLRDSTMA
jgi:DNA-binding LacI/PurR family transcriptional regulator